jgi:hypothetical protein
MPAAGRILTPLKKDEVDRLVPALCEDAEAVRAYAARLNLSNVITSIRQAGGYLCIHHVAYTLDATIMMHATQLSGACGPSRVRSHV